MKRGFLSQPLMNYLVLHYRDMSDKELAEELTKMVRTEIKERTEKIKAALPMVTHAGTRANLNKELTKYENFKGITPGCVRNWAKRTGCSGKSRIHIAMMNREKARVSNIKVWTSKAKKVEQFRPFLETMSIREVRYVIVSNQAQLNSYRTAISNFNKEVGRLNGISITGTFKRDINVFRLEAVRDYSNCATI